MLQGGRVEESRCGELAKPIKTGLVAELVQNIDESMVIKWRNELHVEFAVRLQEESEISLCGGGLPLVYELAT